VNRIAGQVGSRAKVFKLVKHDKKLVRFYLPLEPKNPDDTVWSVIRTLSDKIGEQLTTHLRAIADANPLLKGIIDRIDFNATTHGRRDIDDDRLSNLIEEISAKRLGLADVEPEGNPSRHLHPTEGIRYFFVQRPVPKHLIWYSPCYPKNELNNRDLHPTN
jgi:type I restriction enzyme M protein